MLKNLTKPHHILAVIAILFLTLFFTFPGVINISSKLIGEGGDTYQYVGFQTLVTRKLENFEYPFSHTTFWRYPIGFDFSRGYDSFLSNLTGGFIGLVLGDPVVTYNLTILLSFFFNSVCGYLLFFRLSKSWMISLIGSVSFGFSFYNLARGSGHANLLLTGGFALLGYSIVRLWQNHENRAIKSSDFLWLGISLTIIGLSSAQYFILAGIVLAIGLIFGLMLFPQRIIGLTQTLFQNKKYVFRALIPVILMIWVVFIPIIQAVIEGGFAWRTDGDYSPALINLFAPNPFLSTTFSQLGPIDWEARDVEHVIFMGWAELIAGALSIYILFKKGKNTQILLWSILLLAIISIFMLGTKNPETGIILPYHWLISIYPFKAVSEPGRYVIVVNLLLLSIITLGLANIKSKEKQTKIVLILLFLVVFERISWGGYYQVTNLKAPFIDVVKKLPSDAVFNIPTYISDHNFYAHLYDKPIVHGYMHWLGDTHSTRSFVNYNNEIPRFLCDDRLSQSVEIQKYRNPKFISDQRNVNQSMINRFRANNIRTIVVHKDLKLTWPGCSNVMALQTALFPPLMIAKSQGLRPAESHIEWAGLENPEVGLFFPRGGTISIQSVHFSPNSDLQSFRVTLDDELIDTASWNYEAEPDTYSFWTGPGDKNSTLNVKPGSVLRFSTSSYQEKGFITINYYYNQVLDNNDPESLIRNGLEKKYEDKFKEVYWIL